MKSYRNPVEQLEDRRLMHATLRGTDVRVIADDDGTKENGNIVVLKFSGPIQSANLNNMRMFGYSTNTLLGGQQKSTINIKSAEVEGSTVLLRTDVQIRKGSSITLNAGAVTAADGHAVTGSIRTAKGLNRDRFTLALRSFSAADKSYFSAQRIAGGKTPTVANTAQSESTVRADLDAFLTKKVNGKFITAQQKSAAMDRFDSASAKSLVSTPNLRAAIVSLVGTVAEPAIGYYLEKKNATGKDLVQFNFDGASFSSGARIVETSYTNSGRLKSVWNPNYAGESFAVLSGIVAHETIHEGSDKINSQDEEVIANFVEGVVWAQQIVADFTQAQKGTQLTTRANYRLMLLLNSGDRQFPRVGIKAAPLKNVAAGAAPGFTPEFDSTPASKITSFEDDVREEFKARDVADKNPTDSQATARTIIGNITGQKYDSSWKFGDAFIDEIDIQQDTLSDAFAMRAARVLQLKV